MQAKRINRHILLKHWFNGHMQKVGYAQSPLEDGSLDGFSVHPVPLTTLTVEALKEFDLSRKDAGRSKNMFALGLLSWMYSRPTEGTLEFVRTKFAAKPQIAEANPIPAWLDRDSWGRAVTQISARLYPRVPTTHGF